MSERTIIKIDRASVKNLAKQSMKGRKPSVYLVSVVYLVIVNILSELSSRMQYGNIDLSTVFAEISQGNAITVPELSLWGTVLLLAVTAMSNVITIGFQNFCLRVGRRQHAGIGEIFDIFSLFFKAFALIFMMGIFILLWSCLFIIPGIIAAYRYSFAPYILIDYPDKGVMQCIRESKEMTRGYKRQLFVLDLSFIGWMILAEVPAVLFGVSPVLCIAASILISAFVSSYRIITESMYYNRLSDWTGVITNE